MLQNKAVLNVWFVEDIKHKNYKAKKMLSLAQQD